MDPKAGITRIVLTASQLADLIHQRPEVEVTLIDNAVAQVAEQLKRKIAGGDIGGRIFADIERDLARRFGSSYQLPKEVTEAMRAAAAKSIEVVAADTIRKAVNDAVDKAMTHAQSAIDKRIGDIIATKFSDMVKAAALVRR